MEPSAVLTPLYSEHATYIRFISLTFRRQYRFFFFPLSSPGLELKSLFLGLNFVARCNQVRSKRNSSLPVVYKWYNLAQDITFQLLFCSILCALVVALFVCLFNGNKQMCLKRLRRKENDLYHVCMAAYHPSRSLCVVTSSFWYGLRMDYLPTIV